MHNSVGRAGNYDMTDYDGMVTFGVLNLTDLTNCKTYNRIDPAATNFLGAPMPMEGFSTSQKSIKNR